MAKIPSLDSVDDTPETAPKTMKVNWLGRDWNILTTYNAFAAARLAAANDPAESMAAFYKMFLVLVVPEERGAWIDAITDSGFEMDVLLAKMQEIQELVGKEATPSPATSRGTPARKTSARKSTVVSSSAPASA